MKGRRNSTFAQERNQHKTNTTRQSTDYRIWQLEIYTQKQTYPHHWNIPPTTKYDKNTSNAMFVDDFTYCYIIFLKSDYDITNEINND